MQPLTENDPTVVGRYEIVGRLGSGGMGVVYLGRSPGGRKVAVKVVHAGLARDPDFRRRFKREVEAASRVGGHHTAGVVDADPDADPPWLVTTYIAGPTLAQSVAENGPLSEDGLRTLGAGLAEALEAIHATGLVHRDLKPSNVLVTDNGPRVIDFGIARALDETSITRSRLTIGTPGFMAPEQIAGEPAGPPCDVFCLGQVLCHAAGVSPFGDGTAPVMLYRIVHNDPDLAGIPASLRVTIAACLAKNPADRPTAAELLSRLAAPPPPQLPPTVQLEPSEPLERPEPPEVPAPLEAPSTTVLPKPELASTLPAAPPPQTQPETSLQIPPQPRRKLWISALALLVVAGAATGIYFAAASSGSNQAGGPGNPTTSTTDQQTSTDTNTAHATAPPDPAAATSAIKDTWTSFFSSSTSASDETALVQNGTQMAPVLNALATQSQGHSPATTVSDVTFTDPDDADVTFSVQLDGQTVISDATGHAVHDLSSDRWQVSQSTVCAIGSTAGVAASALSSSGCS